MVPDNQSHIWGNKLNQSLEAKNESVKVLEVNERFLFVFFKLILR